MAHDNAAFPFDEFHLTSFSKQSRTTSITEINKNKSHPDNNVINVKMLENESDAENGHTAENDDNKSLAATTQTNEKSPHPIFFYISISFFAMCGCMARIGVDRLFGSLLNLEESGGIVNESFFSNILGSFVLGALNASPLGKTRLAVVTKGLTTGFCGSFTTWSKWNQQLSLMLIGEGDSLNFIGGDFVSTQPQILSIAGWFIGFYTFVGSYCVGWDFGKDIGPKIKLFKVTKNSARFSEKLISILLLLCGIGFGIGCAFDSTETGKKIWLAVLFAPFGACLRSWLSQFRVDRFKLPLGTLLANCLGAITLAALHVVDVRAVASDCTGLSLCWGSILLYAVGTGFCACLTTVSTFMSEVFKLRSEHPRFAYGYLILTVVVCQVICGIINGVNLHYPYK